VVFQLYHVLPKSSLICGQCDKYSSEPVDLELRKYGEICVELPFSPNLFKKNLFSRAKQYFVFSTGHHFSIILLSKLKQQIVQMMNKIVDSRGDSV
jgi:hypothetical protein